MAVKRTVTAAVVGQLGHLRGAAGSVAGWVMAHRRSNRQCNRWVVSLLGVQPTDRVLEIGFGPGFAIAELSRFWPAERLGERRRRPRPGGRTAVACQQRCGAKAQTARQIEALLQDAGYTKIRMKTLDLGPCGGLHPGRQPATRWHRSPPASGLTS